MESKFPVIPELNIQELKKSELILWISEFPNSLVYNLQSIDTLRAVLRKLRDRQQEDTQESDRLEDSGSNTSGQQSAVNDELGDQNKVASTIKLSALDTTINNGEEQASDIPDNELIPTAVRDPPRPGPLRETKLAIAAENMGTQHMHADFGTKRVNSARKEDI
ncbi:hypothetical protein QAD02_008397 [Eretmocerus hayati]|uniref:Uncharacterized protein n=1 Tax=Eretmocerus hayati TaxID=131215 RepID=A0ACC2NAS3_9HYME|nr:hypothetical protein QAD02_008397 [Eretmocerus hayati]